MERGREVEKVAAETLDAGRKASKTCDCNAPGSGGASISRMSPSGTALKSGRVESLIPETSSYI